LEAVEPLIEQARPGNVIVAESTALPKTSRLRILHETSKCCVAIPLCTENERDISVLVAEELRSHGLTIASEAREVLLSLLSAGRLDSRQQISKLVTYCLGRREVTLADVRICCSESGDISSEDLLDAALDGDLEVADRVMARLLAGGASGTRLLSASAMGLMRLQRLRARIDRGDALDLVLKSARPPVFFARQPMVSRQLQLWDSQALASLASSFAAAILNCREYAALEDSIASRTFLSAARAGKALRSGR
jgi:DNA polymerase-3 subunit delta